MTVRIKTNPDSPSRCVFCHDAPGSEGLRPCDGCGATAHPGCRADAPSCSTIGCADKGKPIHMSMVQDGKSLYQLCVGCNRELPHLFDTTVDGQHVGYLCIGCINTGRDQGVLRRRREARERAEIDEAARVFAAKAWTVTSALIVLGMALALNIYARPGAQPALGIATLAILVAIASSYRKR